MNEELKKQLAEVVKESLELAKKTGSFVIEQAPEVLSEFYKWKIFSSIYDIFIAILIFIIVRYAPLLFLSKEKSTNQFDSDIEFFGRYGEFSGFAALIAFLIGSVTSFLMISASLHTLLSIFIAPKMYLINYFLN